MLADNVDERVREATGVVADRVRCAMGGSTGADRGGSDRGGIVAGAEDVGSDRAGGGVGGAALALSTCVVVSL